MKFSLRVAPLAVTGLRESAVTSKSNYTVAIQLDWSPTGQDNGKAIYFVCIEIAPTPKRREAHSWQLGNDVTIRHLGLKSVFISTLSHFLILLLVAAIAIVNARCHTYSKCERLNMTVLQYLMAPPRTHKFNSQQQAICVFWNAGCLAPSVPDLNSHDQYAVI